MKILLTVLSTHYWVHGGDNEIGCWKPQNAPLTLLAALPSALVFFTWVFRPRSCSSCMLVQSVSVQVTCIDSAVGKSQDKCLCLGNPPVTECHSQQQSHMEAGKAHAVFSRLKQCLKRKRHFASGKSKYVPCNCHYCCSV